MAKVNSYQIPNLTGQKNTDRLTKKPRIVRDLPLLAPHIPIATTLTDNVSENDIWQLNAIFGKEKVSLAQSLHKNIGDLASFLFSKYRIILYLDSTQCYLFSHKNNLFVSDFGELKPINGLVVFHRFGLSKIGQAYEKGVVEIIAA